MDRQRAVLLAVISFCTQAGIDPGTSSHSTLLTDWSGWFVNAFHTQPASLRESRRGKAGRMANEIILLHVFNKRL